MFFLNEINILDDDEDSSVYHVRFRIFVSTFSRDMFIFSTTYNYFICICAPVKVIAFFQIGKI